MLDLMLQPLRKYAEFQGRASRSEYWLFYLFTIIVAVVVGIIAGIVGGASGEAGPSLILSGLLGLFGLAIIVPSIALSFRRLHDTDRSAWWLLISLIPFVGGVVLLVFSVLDGTPGPNKYGPDPKGRGETAATVFA
ncbi:MAG TPA: DUF805 domain-containing protein [Phenylobacterium sp.]